ncbi:MAG: phosphoglucomutase/phosphomannomutase family protein [Anaerolineales bacterium]|jgi:phosphomannomutase
MIHFGTDGWRAVISDTFTFHNLRLVSQAIADAVSSPDWHTFQERVPAPDPRCMVVGFDTRFLSDRYAVEVARVLAANGFTAYLAHADAPTPAISFAVQERGAIAGVMITASHNAPRYNGVKLKAAYAGSALPEQCRRVEIYLSDNESRARGPNLMEYDLAIAQNLIRRFNPTLAYHEHLRKLINLDLIASRPPRVVVDSMYGSGRGQIKGLLQGTGCEVFEIRGEMNPGFGGVHPEPIARYLGPLAGAIAAGNGQLGVATDGDADRTGAMDGRGQFVDPHKIMALALRYFVEKRGWTGQVIKTVSTTLMIDRLCRKYGLELHETPVGFNHIADYMLRGDVLIGGEESGGISFRGHIPEGDGVLMGLLLIEMVAAYGVPLEDLVQDLLTTAGPARYERRDLRLSHPVPKSALAKQLSENPPQELGGVKVAQISLLDGVKYLLEDDSWLLIRPSGTEPLLRVYAEAADDKHLSALVRFGETIAQEAL